MSELRFNFVTGDWVIIAPERAKRPEEFKSTKKQESVPDYVATCPLCAGNEDQTPPETFRVKNDGKWIVRAVPNKFAAVNHEESIVRQSTGSKKFYDRRRLA